MRYLLWNLPLFLVAMLVAVVSLVPALQSGWPHLAFGALATALSLRIDRV